MATIAPKPLAQNLGDEGFFLRGAVIIALVIVAGFSFQLAMGRSTFASPVRVHAHAIVFMGWVAIYLMQNVLVATDRMSLHRKLGWIAVVWIPLMIALGLYVTVVMTRAGTVPFFFQPLHFLVFDPVNILAFAGLTTAAIVMRRRTEWHRRLHFCGMSILLLPAFGRLLPLPLLTPWSWEATLVPAILFPIVGLWSDIRRTGRAHPAWFWGIGTFVLALAVTEAITYSPVGLALYEAVTAGSPGANVPPLEFPPPPAGPLMTGRTD
jgi:hypothetical protein